jgi:hypothetical protein
MLGRRWYATISVPTLVAVQSDRCLQIGILLVGTKHELQSTMLTIFNPSSVFRRFFPASSSLPQGAQKK